MLVLPWNAEASIHYANGDVTTQAGSLMDKHGVHLTLERQDDYAQMLAEQVLFASEVAKGVANPGRGAAFVVIMGDGGPGYFAAAREGMGKLGQELEVIGSLGYSRGEDKCMLPVEVSANPQKARGSLIGAVLRDGDWNVCIKYAADNKIPVNADVKTYDPDAMNFVAVASFTEADEKLIAAANSGACEVRPVVARAKLTGEKRKVCQNGSATWTPGDVKYQTAKADLPSLSNSAPAVATFAKREWAIEFESGKASFKVEASGQFAIGQKTCGSSALMVGNQCRIRVSCRADSGTCLW